MAQQPKAEAAVQRPFPGQPAAASAAAPHPFEELLGQLREAHAREVQELRHENAALHARLELNSREHLGADTQHQPPPFSPGEPPPPSVGDTPADAETATTACVSAQQSQQYPSTYVSTQSAGTPCHQKSSWRRRQVKKQSFLFEDIAPRTINLQLLCGQKYPEAQWADLPVRLRVDLLREALKPKHSLIDPHSVFMRWWDILLTISLLHVGLSTPYEVVFYGDRIFWPLFGANRIVDLIFIIDMVIQFFLVVEVRRSQRGGMVLLRDPWALRKRYLTSWFLVDVVSIIPFDVINAVGSGPVMQRAKMMRGIRLLRLAKLLRMLRSSILIRRWRNGIGMTFATQKLFQFVVLIVFVCHWMACAWGFAGLILGTDLCDEQGRFVIVGNSVDQVSWVTTLYLGGKTSPDNPCSPVTVYAASLHWAVMTLTSIGYGDIVPVRLEEYVVCIICMLLGGVMWAYIIGCLCSIASNRSKAQQDFEADTDLLNSAMSEANVPRQERPKYREYLREARAHTKSVLFGQIAGRFSPLLHQELMFSVTKAVIRLVSYFSDPSTPRMLLQGIAAGLSPTFFSRGEPLNSLRHDLCLVDRGTVVHNQKVLMAPSVLHEDFIILPKFKRPAVTTSLTYTQVLALARPLLEELLPEHPEFACRLRERATKMALICAMLTIGETYAEMLTLRGPGEEPSLIEAFDSIFGETSTAPLSLKLKLKPAMRRGLSRHSLTHQLRV